MGSAQIGGGLIAVAALIAAFLLPVTYADITNNGLAVGWGIAALFFISGAWVILGKHKRPAPDTRYEDLAEFVERAALIQQRFLGTSDSSEIFEAQKSWAAEVRAYLRDHVGKGQANQFEFANANAHSGPIGHDLLGGGQYALIDARRRMLAQIMSALPKV
jgi:hypothetical protein